MNLLLEELFITHDFLRKLDGLPSPPKSWYWEQLDSMTRIFSPFCIVKRKNLPSANALVGTHVDFPIPVPNSFKVGN